MHVRTLAIFLTGALCAPTAAYADRVVFGSFRSADNAQNWAQKLTASLATSISVQAVAPGGADPQQLTLYRVVSEDLAAEVVQRLRRRADAAGIRHWRLRTLAGQATADSNDRRAAPTPPLGGARLTPPNPVPEPKPKLEPKAKIVAQPDADNSAANTAASRPAPRGVERSAHTERIEWDLGLQSRLFGEPGYADQDRAEASVSLQLEYYRGWDNDAQSFTVTPFLRLDSADSERTHADLREFFYSRVGDNWDVHVGAKRVFWGVSEFTHLVDIINQTDLVENVDTEDKLGQPMVHLSLVRDWGLLDVYALIGFRERTFAGEDGRIRPPYVIEDDARYESGAEQRRIDFAVRWSHYMGPFEVGVHHFSGTSREPILIPQMNNAGAIVLTPYYPVIDQTGIDAQAFYGDLALKLEAFTRSGFGPRYVAANVGFERTFVGVLGTHADFGLVAEYLFDERGDDAFDTFFANDIALGGRLQFNNFADTKALLGVIRDVDTDDYFVSLEASTRLTDSWLLTLEARVFGGGESLTPNNARLTLSEPNYKTAWLQDEDYLQLELKKFF